MKKNIIKIKLKEYPENYFIADNLNYACEIINTFKDELYNDMTPSNLNNILRGDSKTPIYLIEIVKIDFMEYIIPIFNEKYPNKTHITNKTTLNKYYNKIMENIIIQQYENI